MGYKTPKLKSYLWGIRGVYFIWHGTNADPEVMYKGKVANYYDIEESMWAWYKDSCEILGKEPDSDEGFEDFCKVNMDSVKSNILEIGKRV